VSYQFNGVAFYQSGDPSDLVAGAPSANPDTGYVRITNNGTSTFSGTIGFVAVANCVSTDFSASYPVTLNPGDHVSVSINDESSNYGGYNGDCYDGTTPPQDGAQFVMSGTVTSGADSQPVSLAIYDKDIHSNVLQTNPFGTTLDNYILQGGDPYGQDTGDSFETSQAPGPFVCASDTGICQTPPSSVTVSKLKPSALGQGAAKAKVTITGSGFESGAAVSVTNPDVTVNSVSFVSSTQLTAKLSVATSAATGPTNVVVTNPDSTQGGCGGCLTIDPGPQVYSVSPSSGTRGTTLDVQVFGANFAKGAKVKFGKGITVNSHTFVNDGEIDANITISTTAKTGGQTITVTNKDHGVGTLPDGFTVN
jgi:hypothetical protein